MPFLEKYEALALSDDYVSDPLLLALAWKKSQQYIRSTSWYADNFELDLSALDLADKCQDWADKIKGDELVFKPMHLVPAPKSHLWDFEDPSTLRADLRRSPLISGSGEECLIWVPVQDYQKTPLRPLAHIGIAEQAMMTLVMMCLANKVETEQGNPNLDFEHVHAKEVYSYGNRLHCQYDNDKAEHSYGGTTAYRKYFTDYQKFLARPEHFAKQAIDDLDDESDIYVVELDLENFFNQVNRETLVEKVYKLCDSGTAQSQPNIDRLFNAFTGWEWSASAQQHYQDIYKDAAPKGLPQGLVAAGFFANVYLLEFDKAIGASIGQSVKVNGKKLKLFDYCRYVDDMRLVIMAPKVKPSTDITKQAIQEAVVEMVNNHLKTENLGLGINQNKTTINVYRKRSYGVSNELSKMQSRLSGPVAFDDAMDDLGLLSSLLSISTPAISQNDSDCRINRLAQIESNHVDLREESIKRFAANKIAKLLKTIRHFTTHDICSNGNPLPGGWDYQQEQFARRFIACWSRDPSLVLLLKKGLELFPCTQLLEPVLEQLKPRLSGYVDPYIRSVARYCMAEIFRHSATIIHQQDQYMVPVHARVEAFFERLQHEAAEVVSSYDNKQIPEFDLLAEQARFLLLVRMDSSLEVPGTELRHDVIFKLAAGFRNITIPCDMDSADISACIILAAQLVKNDKPLLRAVGSLLATRGEDLHNILKRLAEQNFIFFRSLILHARSVKYEWIKANAVKEFAKQWGVDQRPLLKPLDQINGAQRLLRLVQRPDNPFANEIMALRLMCELLRNDKWHNKGKANSVIDIADTTVKFERLILFNPPRFEAITAPLTIEVKLMDRPFDFGAAVKNEERPLALFPTLSRHLCTEDKETWVLQRTAMCIRAVLIGVPDWTAHQQRSSHKTGYQGIRGSQYKRMLGLFTTPFAIGGEAAQVSDWLTSLLSKLLAWPGIPGSAQSYPWPEKLSLDAVKKLVSDRLKKLEKLYCQQSRMPGLLETVHLDWEPTKKNLSVVMVQSKLPAIKDFTDFGLLLNTPEYRVRHRKHIAKVASLVCKHIDAQRKGSTLEEKKARQVDLIVWPELAVHHDDINILTALSQKTNAIIYAGLTFIEQSGIKGPNNCAIWIVPRKSGTKQKELIRYQGKHHMTAGEKGEVEPWRPYQLMLALMHPALSDEDGFKLTGSICYDATDIALSADLRDKSNAYVISALNKDINTFDAMVDALHYHMYQPVVLVNSGEYGGSCAKAPYSEPYHRLIAHSHGNDQVSINTFEMNMFDFTKGNIGDSFKSDKTRKTAPAGWGCDLVGSSSL